MIDEAHRLGLRVILVISVEWQARRIGQLIAAYEAALPAGGWPNWVLGNHDKPRVSGISAW